MRAQRGVSGVLVVVVMLLLMVGFLASYTLSRFGKKEEEASFTRARLQRAGEALEAYGAAALRLPCPADGTLDTGEEVRTAPTSATCTHTEGTLPWKTIGVRRADAYDEWGNKISYRVYVNGGDGSLTQNGGIDMSQCDLVEGTSILAAGRLCNSNADAYQRNTSSAHFLTNKGLTLTDMGVAGSNRAYVVISHGESGFGAYTSSGVKREDPTGAERDNMRATGPFTIRAFSDTDTNPSNPQHFDDLLFYRTVEDVVKRANLSARDWPEGARMNDATATTMFGGTASNTARNDVTFLGNRFRAQGDDFFSYSNMGGVTGIGVVDSGGTDYGIERSILSGPEYIRIDFAQSATRLAVSLAGFGYNVIGSKRREQVNFRFYSGGSLQGTEVTRQGCAADGGVATLVVQPSTQNGAFDAVEVEADFHAGTILTSSFLLSEIAACGPTVAACTTSLATTANTCFTPSINAVQFTPASTTAGAVSTITLTISNGTDTPAFQAINFTMTLPAGMVIAATPTAQTSCPAGAAFGASAALSATAGGTALVASGLSINNNVATCQVRVNVTAAAAGTYSVGSRSLSSLSNVLNGVSTIATLTVGP